MRELKDTVGGGYIELVKLSDGRLLVCDDSGRIHGLPFNDLATALYLIGRPRSVDWIAGDVLVCESWRSASLGALIDRGDSRRRW